MALETADEVYEQIVKNLPATERLKLRDRIAADEHAMDAGVRASPGRSILDLEGTLEYPARGEDAQDSDTRARREAEAPGESTRGLRWRDIRGIVAYPLLEEDAQDWVSRTRRESDEARERQWKRQREG
jgi:hypothetical protein